MKGKAKSIIILVLVLALLGVLVYFMASTLPTKTYTEFLLDVKENKIESVSVNGYVLTVTLKNAENISGRREAVTKYSANIPYRTELINDICSAAGVTSVIDSGIGIEYNNPNAGSIWSTLIPVLGMLAIGLLILYMFKSSQGGNKQAMNFGKSRARLVEKMKVRFTDVAGAEEEKEELKEIVEFLKNPQKFSLVGAKIPKGVLLVGPPGTGKTLFARAVAGEANVPFFSISGSDFVEMFVGVGASRVRDMFEQAKKHAPSILFIDEIDAVGRQRGAGLGGGNDEREQTLNQLLVMMDGFEGNEGVIVMAATNRSDVLDPALLRPGRFDRQIYVAPPDVRGREQIFKVHARNKPISPEIDFKELARTTSGFTGADIENVLNEAAILTARANRKQITEDDIQESIKKLLMGPAKKSRIVTEADKRITAFHESGHAIAACKLELCDPVQEVTIIPRGMAAGYTLTVPDNDNSHVTKQEMLQNVIMTLGGRAAEEIVIKDVSAGASQDIKVVTDKVRRMVTEYGMSDVIGTINYGSSQEVFLGRDYQTQVNYSEDVASKIDSEMHKIIDECYKECVKILTENRKALDNMAKVLIARETIHETEVDMLMNGASAEEVIAFIDAKYKKEDEVVNSGTPGIPAAPASPVPNPGV